MRVRGLAVAGMLALTAPIAGHATALGPSTKQLVPAPGIVKVWGGCGWVIGAGGEEYEFYRIVRRTVTLAGGLPLGAGVLTVGKTSTLVELAWSISVSQAIVGTGRVLAQSLAGNSP